MIRLQFSESFDLFASGVSGIRRTHVEYAIQNPNKVQSLTLSNDDSSYIFQRYVEEAKDPYLLLILTYMKDSSTRIVQYALKIYPSLTRDIKEKTPLEILDLFANRFGLNIKIGNNNRKFYWKEKIAVNKFPYSTEQPLEIENPNDKETAFISAFKSERGIQTVIDCSLCFCLDYDKYYAWINSQGKITPFDEEAINVSDFAAKFILPRVTRSAFAEKVFISIHDFCFYCRQHPSALNLLDEEQIRDLFLIIVKTIFMNAEGEPFHYDGKLDFKITNPENRYEIITGEFKWWRGDNSAEEFFHQAVRKHSTGQELEIYTIILSRNKDAHSVYKKLVEIYSSRKEIVANSFEKVQPKNSRELFGKFMLSIRGNQIPLYLCLSDLFYQKR